MLFNLSNIYIEAIFLTFIITIILTAYIYSSVPAIICYLSMILFFTSNSGTDILWYYSLLIISFPFVFKILSEERCTPRGRFLSWFLASYGIAALIITLRAIIFSPVAAIVFNSYFSLLYMIDRAFYKNTCTYGIFNRPFNIIRTLGITFINFIFSFSFWSAHPTLGWHLLQEYAVVLLLIAMAIRMFWFIDQNFASIIFGGSFMFSIICYALSLSTWSFMPATILGLENLYSILIGVALIIKGLEKNNRMLQFGGIFNILILVLAQGFNIVFKFV